MKPASLLALLRLVSPSLPIGAYAYSQGLEWATGSGMVTDASGLEEWMRGVLLNGLATLELPMLARIRRAWDLADDEAALRLNKELLAFRDSREARAEERQMGMSLARILVDSGVDAAAPYLKNGHATYLGMFALACTACSIPEEESLLAYCFAWAENHVLAGVKLIPLGQSAGQRILVALTGIIPEAVKAALNHGDAPLYGATLGRSMAQLRHERQDVRLFRS